MNKNLSYAYGTTVRLEAVFHDWNGQLIDPTRIKVIIYDYKYNVIAEEMPYKESEGKYFFDYTTQSKEQKLFYEWNGEIDGKPSIRRGEFMTKFI